MENNKYQLYATNKTNKAIIRHLYITSKGVRILSKTKASNFNYETAIQLQNEYNEYMGYSLMICDENSEHYKFENRYMQWKRKISEDDPLAFEKNDKLQTACELFYANEVLERIINATTENEICRIMITARKTA